MAKLDRVGTCAGVAHAHILAHPFDDMHVRPCFRALPSRHASSLRDHRARPRHILRWLRWPRLRQQRRQLLRPRRRRELGRHLQWQLRREQRRRLGRQQRQQQRRWRLRDRQRDRVRSLGLPASPERLARRALRRSRVHEGGGGDDAHDHLHGGGQLGRVRAAPLRRERPRRRRDVHRGDREQSRDGVQRDHGSFDLGRRTDDHRHPVRVGNRNGPRPWRPGGLQLHRRDGHSLHRHRVAHRVLRRHDDLQRGRDPPQGVRGQPRHRARVAELARRRRPRGQGL